MQQNSPNSKYTITIATDPKWRPMRLFSML